MAKEKTFFAYAALFCALAILAGCAAAPPKKIVQPLTGWQKARLGKIYLEPPQPAPKLEMVTAAKGAMEGAKIAGGLIQGLEYDPDTGKYNEPPLGGAGMAFFALSGALYGAIAASPEEKVMIWESNLKNAYQRRDLQRVFWENFIGYTCGQGLDITPDIQDAALASIGNVDDEALKEQGYVTVAEISVWRVSLAGHQSINPSLRLLVRADITLRHVGGERLIYRNLIYRSEKHEFDEWADDNAKLFKDRLETSLDKLAKAAVESIFHKYENIEGIEIVE